MTRAVIPAACPSCGALFVSRFISVGGDVKDLMLSNNRETCPYCGAMANTADGIFDVTDGILSVVSAPNITRQMLANFEAAVKSAYANKTPPEQLAREVESIDKSLGDVVRKVGKNNHLYIAALLVILAAIKSCNVDVKVDANRLIEQVTQSPPAAVVGQNPQQE
jgi:hypothetical protein